MPGTVHTKSPSLLELVFLSMTKVWVEGMVRRGQTDIAEFESPGLDGQWLRKWEKRFSISDGERSEATQGWTRPRASSRGKEISLLLNVISKQNKDL